MSRIVNPAAALLMLASLGGAAPPVEQVATLDERKDDVAAVQVGSAAATVVQIDQAAVPAKATADAGPQLAPRQRQVQPGSQLAPAEQRGRAPSQIYDPRKTAEASPALTPREEGRDTAVIVVEGYDRCDADVSSEKPLRRRRSDAGCANVLEARADEFRQPDPLALSFEQRLQAARPRSGEVRSVDLAARRLGSDGVPVGQLEQGMAVTAQVPSAEQQPDVSKQGPRIELPEGASTLIEIVAAGLTGQN